MVARLREAGCVFAEEEAALIALQAPTRQHRDTMVERRVAGEPLEQVLGWASFCGLRIHVEPGVFVPRRRTEHLVEQAVGQAHILVGAGRPSPLVIVDLCCGTGAVGAAVATVLTERGRQPGRSTERSVALPAVELPAAVLHAVDRDPVAVRCARRVVEPLGGHVHEGDLYQPLPASLQHRVDLLTANVPYVPSGELALLPSEARDHEPVLTLDGGADGLDVVRRVADGARGWLAPGGCLLVECSERQGATALGIFADGGLTAHLVRDEHREATVVVGRA